MVIGLQIRKLHRGAESAPPPAVLDSKKPGLFRVNREQRSVFFEAERVDNIFQWDVPKNMRQIKSYDDRFLAIRALTVHKFSK